MAAKKKMAKKVVKRAPKKPPKLSDDDLVEAIPETSAPTLSDSPIDPGLSGNRLHKAMLEFVAHQNQRAGTTVAAFADQVPNTYSLRRPSGIMQLDIDTAGGLAAGGLSYISGPDNAGKTFLLMLYMLMHQHIYGEGSALAFGCVEGGFDFARALNVGLKIAVPDEVIAEWQHARMYRGFPAYTKEEWLSFKQQTGEFVILRGSTGEELMQATLEAIRSKLFGIVAVDSVSVLLPTADAAKDLEDPNKVAARASLITDFMAHYLPLTTGLGGINRTTTIFTSQVRANTERSNKPSHMQKYIKEWQSTGAYSARHAKLLDVTIWSGAKIKKKLGGNDTIVGKNIHYDLSKGKAGTHDNITGEFSFFYDNFLPCGVDRFDTVITEGIRAGIIRETGGTIDVIQPETGKPGEIRSIPGFHNFKRMMEIDFDFEMAVRREVLAARGISCLYH